MKLLSKSIAIFLLSQFFSCATPLKTTMLGGAAGAAAGAGIGMVAYPGYYEQNQIRNVGIGAGIGLITGALLGFLSHKFLESKESDAVEKGKKDLLQGNLPAGINPNEPTLLPPKIESRYVEDQVRGNVYIPAHYEYFILEPAKWSR